MSGPESRHEAYFSDAHCIGFFVPIYRKMGPIVGLGLEQARASYHSAPGEVVARLMFASRSCIKGPVFDEMHRIRDHAIYRNAADGVYVALLHQSGYFMEWMEGPTEGVRAALARVTRDPRHHHLRLLHQSHGPRCLTQPWSMAIRQNHETPPEFARRVDALRETHSHNPSQDPASIWRRLSMPLTGSDVARQVANEPFQLVMVCSARGAASFDVVHWLGETHQRPVMTQRLGGADLSMGDVAMDYVDLDRSPRAVVRRVVAIARNGLLISLTRAFLPEYSHVMLVLSGDIESDANLMHLLLSACSQPACRPVVVGVGPRAFDHTALQQMAEATGLVYLDCSLGGDLGPAALWSAAEPALDFSIAANSGWPELERVA